VINNRVHIYTWPIKMFILGGFIETMSYVVI